MEGKEGERVKRGRTRLHSGHRDPVGKIYTLACGTLACVCTFAFASTVGGWNEGLTKSDLYS